LTLIQTIYENVASENERNIDLNMFESRNTIMAGTNINPGKHQLIGTSTSANINLLRHQPRNTSTYWHINPGTRLTV
jgi:hypothetical protein